MSLNRTVIITPIFKPLLNSNETISLKHSFSVLASHDIIFICPNHLNIAFYREHFPQAKYCYYLDNVFESTLSYSILLTSSYFYESFISYSHMLIVQTDCIVLQDDLDYWCLTCFDYIGAPWANTWIYQVPKIGSPIDGRTFYMNVGNGGLSLRKISSVISVLKELSWIRLIYNEIVEDAFFSLAGQVSLNFLIPNSILAAHFSIETEPRAFFNTTKKLPMGTHAWEIWDKAFWLEVFEQNGIHGMS